MNELTQQDKLIILDRIRRERKIELEKKSEALKQRKAAKAMKESIVVKNDGDNKTEEPVNIVEKKDENNVIKNDDDLNITPHEMAQIEKEIKKKQKEEKRKQAGLLMKLKVYQGSTKKEQKKVKKIIKSIESSSSSSESEESDEDEKPQKNNVNNKNNVSPAPIIDEVEQKRKAHALWIKQQAMDFFA